MNTKRFLLVEQDQTYAKIMSMVITNLGHDHVVVSTDREARQYLSESHFDTVIANLHIPEEGGLDLMAAVTASPPVHRPDFILTGYGKDYSYNKIIGAGALDFIKKPFAFDGFNIKIEHYLKTKALQEKNDLLLETHEDLNKRLTTLIDVSCDLTAELDYKRLFPLIIGKVSHVMKAERSSLYVIDWHRQELWTKVAEGIDTIRVPLGKGICGHVAVTGNTVNVPDAWESPYFKKAFDQRHNFRTRSVLCIPIINRSGEKIGVLQVINKLDGTPFNLDDETFLKGLASQVSVSLENSLLHEEVRLSFDSSITTLSAIVDARHPYTAGHSERVTVYTLMIAKQMGLGAEMCEVLKYAALLHDIGKIGIRDDILLKNGRFTEAERREMNTHPIKTKAILDKFHFPTKLKEVPVIAAHHHERVNGKGYPHGLRGNEMHIGSKIIAVADVFDALTSKRDYPKYDATETMESDPMPLDRAISILKKDSGTHFDPQVADAFLTCLPQALFHYRGSHFSKDYVDGTISQIAPQFFTQSIDNGLFSFDG